MLILWAVLTGGFFCFLLRRTLRLPAVFPRQGNERQLADLAAALLFFSVLIPYRPEDSRFFSALHTIFAFSSSVLLYAIMLLLNLKLYFGGYTGMSRLTAALFFAGLFSVALFFLAGFMISSALEIFFTVFSCVWFTAFHKRAAALTPE